MCLLNSEIFFFFFFEKGLSQIRSEILKRFCLRNVWGTAAPCDPSAPPSAGRKVGDTEEDPGQRHSLGAASLWELKSQRVPRLALGVVCVAEKGLEPRLFLSSTLDRRAARAHFWGDDAQVGGRDVGVTVTIYRSEIPSQEGWSHSRRCPCKSR